MEPDKFNFGTAIAYLKQGRKVCRQGWNGKGMWLTHFIPEIDIYSDSSGDYVIQPCICMKTAQNTFQIGWLASQLDMLSEDWMLVD